MKRGDKENWIFVKFMPNCMIAKIFGYDRFSLMTSLGLLCLQVSFNQVSFNVRIVKLILKINPFYLIFFVGND